jgi:hypothetical protein
MGYWALVIVIIAAGRRRGSGPRERPVEVEAATVTERPVGTQAAVLNASGYVTARRRAMFRRRLPEGHRSERGRRHGGHVGQVLARLDDSTPRAALALAVAQAESARKAVNENEVHLAQARLTLRRVTDLRKKALPPSRMSTSRSDVDGTDARNNALRGQVTVAERQIELQQTDLDNTVIRAPFTGVAISKDAQPGEMVSPVSAAVASRAPASDDCRHAVAGDRGRRQRELHQPGNLRSMCRPCLMRIRTGRSGHVITTVPTADRQKATVLVRIGSRRWTHAFSPTWA